VLIFLSIFTQRSSLIFIPSVGPGYIDTRVRAWNGLTTRHRRKGDYYKLAWRTATSLMPKFVSITSFNEWHEGTQIETAIPKTAKDRDNINFTYLSYEPDPPDVYLTLTRTLIEDYEQYKNLNKTIT
jgi:glycoprotein endo-alpha-1,2-mannosidase